MRLLSRRVTAADFARIGVILGWLLLGDCRVVTAQTPACAGIHVTVFNIRNARGTVDCALFDGPAGFPVDVPHSAMRLMAMKVPNSQAQCDFENISAGTYGLVVLHDENMNGKLDSNWLGIPKEGYGFSKDAKASFGAPSFADASFVYDGNTLALTITLRY
jgi:uncharacterized protein (DUF2141 family)